ncbi:MAG: hypothetical protein S4CHLAM102_03000 [Chlamydiia bacterium]|nr:hypothetical protein [Chlamydiia bacterium]
MVGVGTYELLLSSIIILILASVADVLDGAVARAIRAESDFGLMFDSISDMVTFGVAPSVLMIRSLSPDQEGPIPFFILMGAMLYTICGAFRLVRFSMRAVAEKGGADKMAKGMFVGMPIPAAAAAVTSANLFLHSYYVAWFFDAHPTLRAGILVTVMIFIGYAMINRWRFPSLKNMHFRVPSFNRLFLGVIGSVAIFYGLLYYFPILYVGISWSYILAAIGLTIYAKIRMRRLSMEESLDQEDSEVSDEVSGEEKTLR